MKHAAPIRAAIRLALLAALPVAALAGCASTACPPEAPISALPLDAQRALNLRGGLRAEQATRPDGTVRVTMRSDPPVRTGVITRGESGVITLPLERAGMVWDVRATALSFDGSERTTLMRVDTGHSGQLSLDGGKGTRLGAKVLAGVSPGLHQTAFGPKESRLALLRGIRFGDDDASVTLAPIGAEVECGGPAFDPLLGIDAIDRFGHVLFDWTTGEMICVLPGEDMMRVRTRPGWVSLAWDAGQRVEVERSSSRPGESRRTVLRDHRRAVLIELDGETRHAMLDTGFSGGVFCFETPDKFESRGTISARGHGRRGTFRVGELESGRFGPIDLAGLEIYVPMEAAPGFVERAGYDAIIGLELLERFPLWLDFESGQIRLWTGDGPMPRPE